YAMVEEVTATKTTDEWLTLLKGLSIPVQKTNRFEDLEGDPHLEAVGLFERYDHPHLGPYKAIRPPVKFEKTPSNIRRHPPRLGEQTDEVFAEVRQRSAPE
ncbi:MAG: CoA transferase, partial [Phenylobacterium sp.]|nr:CoA transferase [Phenylobacterium sp.]